MTESKLFLFSSQKDDVSRRLQKSIKSFVTGENTEISRTVEDLFNRLCRRNTCSTLALLLAVSRKELDDLLNIGDLFLTIPSILILPDDKRATIAKGHKLFPRFISFVDSDFKEVGTVLEKMLKARKKSNSVDPVSNKEFSKKNQINTTGPMGRKERHGQKN